MKSPEYAKVRILIHGGHIKDFLQIAVEVQKNILCADLKMGFRALTRRINNPGLWQIDELAQLSDLLEIDHQILFKMADELRKKKKGKR